MSSSHILFHGARRCRKKNAKRKNGTNVLLCGEQISSLAVFYKVILFLLFILFLRVAVSIILFSAGDILYNA